MDVGLQAEDPTIAELLKAQGYATGQFGKNHLGDMNKYLPTVHGFDEFFGNLYHLNAEEEPEDRDYPDPKEFPKFKAAYGPRGVLHCWATDADDPTEQPRWGRIGKQKIEDTGALTRKRMETCDDEFVAAAGDFMKRQHAAGKPFFCWVNTTHMHWRTHTKPESLGQAGRWQSPYHDTMIDHDRHVGQLLDLLDELGIADDTIVMYSTDNGPHMNSWPDGAMTPFRSEKNTNWEGAFRIPLLVRWPGMVPAGFVTNEIVQHHDWLPTFLAMAGEPDIVAKLLQGYDAAGKRFKVHIDGYDLLPFLTERGRAEPAQGAHLLQRRRRPGRGALRQLEGRLHGAALRGDDEGVGGTLRAAAHAETLQPADRPAGARRHDVEHLLRVVPGQDVHAGGRLRHRRGVPEDVQGVSTAAAGSVVHHRPGAGEDAGGDRRRRSLSGDMEALLHEFARCVALVIEGIAIVIIAAGSAKALLDFGRITIATRRGQVEKRVISLDYAHWLVAGLTFQLAADVVSTSFAPSWNELGRLAAVAAIRTFLSYFLDHEMETTRRLQQAPVPSESNPGRPQPSA